MAGRSTGDSRGARKRGGQDRKREIARIIVFLDARSLQLADRLCCVQCDGDEVRSPGTDLTLGRGSACSSPAYHSRSSRGREPAFDDHEAPAERLTKDSSVPHDTPPSGLYRSSVLRERISCASKQPLREHANSTRCHSTTLPHRERRGQPRGPVGQARHESVASTMRSTLKVSAASRFTASKQ